MPLPVLIAAPHAGRAYPAQLLANMRDPALSQLRLEDRYVDRVAAAVARETGTGLLVAHAPRAMIDLNRAADDIDWGMVRAHCGDRKGQSARGEPKGGARTSGAAIGSRARSGLGLVPRRLPGFGEIWREKLSEADLEQRIDAIHTPYHRFLESELERIRDIWGAVLLIDLHSMPPLRRAAGSGGTGARVRFVLGDRFGASCDPALIAHAFAYLERQGCAAAHNRPYSGGYVLDRHSRVRHGIHAVQVEVCRSTYLDKTMSEPTTALRPLARMLAGLVREMGAQTAKLGMGGQFPQAAE